ncbi:MAG: four helix bundle protein [bacterium]|nr:four helix bundle protein [bacterium]MDT8367312.1 four helix bundle protein [bacterium]
MTDSKKIKSFEDLIVWQKAGQLAVSIHQLIRTGEMTRDLNFRDQIGRASISVMSNVAEGFERFNPKEFRSFLSIARGSVAEVRSLLHLARNLSYIPEEKADELIKLSGEISRMLAGLKQAVEKKIS